MNTKYGIILLAMLSFALVSLSEDAGRTASDGKTSATWKKQSKDSLPPDTVSWAIIGKVEGVRGNVVKYNEKLYRGGAIFSKTGARNLKRLGVNTVIAITPTDTERQILDKANLELVEIPFEKDQRIPSDMLAFFLKVVEEKEGPFYVHCGTGFPRAGALNAAYRVNIQHWTCERAIMEFKEQGGNTKTANKLLESIER